MLDGGCLTGLGLLVLGLIYFVLTFDEDDRGHRTLAERMWLAGSERARQEKRLRDVDAAKQPRQGTALAPFELLDGAVYRGRVRVGVETWAAVSTVPIAGGQRVAIVRQRGLELDVAPSSG